MKKVIFSLMVIVVALAVGCNQGGNTNDSQQEFGPRGGGGFGDFNPEDMVDQQINAMTERMELTSEQITQLRAVMMENYEGTQQMRGGMQGGNNGDFEDMRAQMQQMREQQDAKIQEILTDEQWQEYQAMQEERSFGRGQGGPRNFNQ